MRKILLSLLSCSLVLGIVIAAETDSTIFREIYEPQLPELQLPRPVKIALPVQNFKIAIIEKESGAAQPWQKIKQTANSSVQSNVVESSALIGDMRNLTDENSETFAEFNLDADDGEASVTLQSATALSSKQLRIVLAQNIALPHEIEITAQIDNNWKTILARSRLNSSVVNFPQNSANEWRIKFWHAQPLRIAELKLVDANSRNFETGEEYVWLARPGESYLVYANSAGQTQIAVSESGNLLGNPEKILEILAGENKANPNFVEPDSDKDGVANIRDNCVSLANSEQIDLDSNGRGDACEDHDGDGIMDNRDNCAFFANRNQKDTDADGIGDACDDSESRLTEQLPWLPWAAMAGVGVVIIFIIVQTIRSAQKTEES